MKTCQALIILHGWASSKEKWQRVKESIEQLSRGPTSAILTEVGPLLIKVIVPDLPGFKKETELNRPWNLDDYVNWFEKFSSEISEPFFLLGHSFGGRLAIKFVAKHPERLKGLILVGVPAIKEELNIKKLTARALSKFTPKFYFPPFYQFLRKIFYKFFLGKTDYLLLEGVMKETYKKIITEDSSPFLPQIKTKTLILWGDKDDYVPVKLAYLMKEKILNSKLIILLGVKHSPHREIPERLAEIIMQFIKS